MKYPDCVAYKELSLSVCLRILWKGGLFQGYALYSEFVVLLNRAGEVRMMMMMMMMMQGEKAKWLLLLSFLLFGGILCERLWEVFGGEEGLEGRG